MCDILFSSFFFVRRSELFHGRPHKYHNPSLSESIDFSLRPSRPFNRLLPVWSSKLWSLLSVLKNQEQSQERLFISLLLHAVKCLLEQLVSFVFFSHVSKNIPDMITKYHAIGVSIASYLYYVVFHVFRRVHASFFFPSAIHIWNRMPSPSLLTPLMLSRAVLRVGWAPTLRNKVHPPSQFSLSLSLSLSL